MQSKTLRPTLMQVEDLLRTLDIPSMDRAELIRLSGDDQFHDAVIQLLNGHTDHSERSKAILLIRNKVSVHISPRHSKGETMNPAEGNQDSEKTDSERFASYTIFANESALCFNASQTTRRFQTLSADGAKKSSSQIDWKTKISIQLSARELPEFYAVLRGYSQNIKIIHPGTKTLDVRWQSGSLFFSLSTKAFTAAVPAQPGDIFHLCALALRQLAFNYPQIAICDIDRMVNDISRAAIKGP